MLSILRILHPTDFSEQSAFALRMASSLARDHGAALVIAHVARPPMPLAAEGLVVVPTIADIGAIREELNDVRVDEPSISVRRTLLIGDPATEILQLADDMKCDLIVLGTHGRTGLRRLLMGSVAEEVVRKASCPVLTVKNPPAPVNSGKTDRALLAAK